MTNQITVPKTLTRKPHLTGLGFFISGLICLPFSVFLLQFILHHVTPKESYTGITLLIIGFGWVWVLGLILSILSLRPGKGQTLWLHIGSAALIILSILPLISIIIIVALRANNYLTS